MTLTFTERVNMNRHCDIHHPPHSPYDPEWHQRHSRLHENHPHQHCHPPLIDDRMSRETVRVVELKDKCGKTKFKIALTDFDDPTYPQHDDQQKWDEVFQVTVVSFCCSETDHPIVLFEESYRDYAESVRKFNALVKQYREIIDIESRGWQDIRAFAEKIEFTRIDPDCCKNCIWAKEVDSKDLDFRDWKRSKKRIVCMNPDVFKVEKDITPYVPHKQIDPRHPFEEDRYRTSDSYFDEKLHVDIDLLPYTFDDGICKNYSRNVDQEKNS